MALDIEQIKSFQVSMRIKVPTQQTRAKIGQREIEICSTMGCAQISLERIVRGRGLKHLPISSIGRHKAR